MAEIIQDLKLQNDPTTIVRPNIVTGSIPSSAVTGDKIADGAITTSKVNDGAITSDKIAPASVIGGKLGVSSVYDLNIASGAVNEYKLASNAVVTSKINNGAVTDSKIAAGAVTDTKIATGAVTRFKILRTDNYIIDDDYGDDIDDFVMYFTNLFKSGFRFYFDDENGYIAQVDSIAIGHHSVTLYSNYPLQGMQGEQVIDASNISTYFEMGGNGRLLHYCGA